MENPRSFLKHEVLNLITLINFLVDDPETSSEKRAQMQSHLKMLTVLIAEEDVFLDKKKTFLAREIKLDDVIEILLDSLKNQFSIRNCSVQSERTNLKFTVDFEALKSGIENLLSYLTSRVKQIRIKAHKSNKGLLLACEPKIKISVEDHNLIKALKEKKAPDEIFLILGLKLMRANGLSINSRAGAITILQT